MASRNTDWQRYATIAKHAQIREWPKPIPIINQLSDILFPLCDLRALEWATAGEFSSDYRTEAELLAAKKFELASATVRALALAKQEAVNLNDTLTPQQFTRLAKNLRVQIADCNSSVWEQALIRTAGLFKLRERPEAFQKGLVDLIVLLGMYADDNGIDMHDMLGSWASSLPA